MKNRNIYLYILSFIFSLHLSAQEQLTNIPTFYITTDDGGAVTSKDEYKKGYLSVKSTDPSEELNIVTEIRKRGNSTFGMPKPPFRIKLDKKTHLLNLPARAKSWVLLANYADKTLIRNALACKISEELSGLEFDPAARFVDVVLNGEYLGNYMLTDQMEVNEGRVPVEEHSTNNITGGYLIEVDGFAGSEPLWFSTTRGVPVTIKYPKYDEINEEQKNYIITFTKQFETLLFASYFTDPERGYRSMVDENSLIDWYIACELTGNSDAFWSIYIYKYKDQDKFFFGPLWDFDIAFNNDQRLGNATRKLMRDAAHDPKTWIRQLWQDDWFKESVHKRWLELIFGRNMQKILQDYIHATAEEIHDSQKLNFEKWPVLNTRVYNEVYLFPTYEQGIDYLYSYIGDRIEFLTESFSGSLNAPHPEFIPEENTTYYIANLKTRNRITVPENIPSEYMELELWNPLEEEEKQEWSFIPVEDDIYRILHHTSGLALTGNGRNNQLILAAPDPVDKQQQWKITPVKNRVFGIVNEHSGYSVNNSGENIENGTPVIEYDSRITQSFNQQWVITAATLTTGTHIKPAPVAQHLIVYPNPATDIVNIRFPGLSEKNLITGEIFSIDGKCVSRFSNTVSAHQEEITIPLYSLALHSGVYLLKVKINDKVFTEKLIIQAN
ncbi:MAG: CotH kinase family protein [Candidatus Azobacteroides sp.]|nr:CotH kinase family protein [Candidatus Azobacteroides sp.]